jgi:hypothetical protein
LIFLFYFMFFFSFNKVDLFIQKWREKAGQVPPPNH